MKMKNEVRPNGVKRRSHTHTSDEAINPMVKDEFRNQSVQIRMVWLRRHPRGELVS